MSKYSEKKERQVKNEFAEKISEIETDELIVKYIDMMKNLKGQINKDSISLMKEMCKRVVKYYGVSVQWTQQCLSEIEGI